MSIDARERKRKQRQSERSIEIPACANQKRRAHALEHPAFFGETYFASRQMNLKPVFTTDPSPSHRAWFDGIIETISYGLQKAQAAPRGGAKTSITVIGGMWAVFAGRVKGEMLCAYAQKRSESELLGFIKMHLLRNDLLCADFPEICVPIRESISEAGRIRGVLVRGEPINLVWTADRIVFPTIEESPACGAYIVARGLESGIRGAQYGSQRIDLALVDDWLTAKAAKSATMMQSVRDVVLQDIGGTGGHTEPMACFVLCTVIEPDDISDEFTDPARHPEWAGMRESALLQLPSRMDLWEQYREKFLNEKTADPTGRGAHKFYLDNRKEMDAGCVEFWPSAFIRSPGPDGKPLESSWTEHCMRLWAAKGDTFFWAELQNNPAVLSEDEIQLTPERVRQQLSGYPLRVAPDDTVRMVRFIDVGKKELHYCIMSETSDGLHPIIDYDVELVGEVSTTSMSADLIERMFEAKLRDALERLHQEHCVDTPFCRADGRVIDIDLTLIDTRWSTHVIQSFVSSHGPKYRCYFGHGTSQGLKSFMLPQPGDGRIVRRQNWYGNRFETPPRIWRYHGNSDHWKLQVWEGFLASPSAKGAVSLFGNDPNIHRRIAHHISKSEKYDWDRRRWDQVTKYNHYFDCAAGCLCALDMLAPRQTSSQSKQTQQAVVQVAPSRKSGAATNWTIGR